MRFFWFMLYGGYVAYLFVSFQPMNALFVGGLVTLGLVVVRVVGAPIVETFMRAKRDQT